MTNLRNYIDELTGKVAEGKQAGKSVADLQRTITVASLNSMQSNGYAKFLVDVQRVSEPNFGPPAPLQNGVNANIADIYKNLDRV
jgi:hypothetical protein